MAYIIDTETTGLRPPIEVTELAYQHISWDCIVNGLTAIEEGTTVNDLLTVVFAESQKDSFLGRFKPSKAIEAKAAELTGITNELVKNCPPSGAVKLPAINYFIAHNAVFDWRVLGKPEVKRVCTKEIAQNIFADCKKDGLANNKLSTLIGFFYPKEAEQLLKDSHGALQDIKLVYLLLLQIKKKLPKADSFAYLLRYCSQAEKTYEGLDKAKAIPKTRFKEVNGTYCIMFGKHSGTPIKEVPKDYMRWVYDNATNSEEERELIRKFW